MREPNLCFPNQNRASLCITSALYDRRALDCTATLPLINSLTHLAYLTSTSPRIREILSLDGGLEQLVRLLSAQQQPSDLRGLWKWSLAFQCVVNVGVRGTEQIRTRVVEAGTVTITLRVLQNFLRALEVVSREKSQEDVDRMLLSAIDPLLIEPIPTDQLEITAEATSPFSLSTLPAARHGNKHERNSSRGSSDCSKDSSDDNNTSENSGSRGIQRRTFPYVKISGEQRRRNRNHRQTFAPPSSASVNIDNVFYREEDILMSLQLLAYLSKYSHIRDLFHLAYSVNVFSVVQKFTFPIHPKPIQYWAGVVMRNACRKDEIRGGIRQCANMHCGKREQKPREFAKCRRCRKAKYCSKPCQSKAWSDGHRWWCVERQSPSPAVVVAAASSATTPGMPSTTSTSTDQQQSVSSPATESLLSMH